MYKNIKSFSKIAEFGRKLLSRPSLEIAIPIISTYAKDLLEAERCSVFIYNEKKNCLWTVLSDGISAIEISVDEGIVGASFRNSEALIVNDPYSDTRFSSKIDHDSGYLTKNIISIPIFDAFRKPIGVLQLLNKTNGDFDQEDKRLLIFFNHYISGYVELANYFNEECKQ
jgi:signal transduction protein with GAF and PtsI domain